MKNQRRVRGCIYQRGQTWWVKFSQNGVSHCESSESSDKRVAQRLLDTRLAAVTTGEYTGRTRATVAELAEEMLRDYRTNNKRSIDHAKMRWESHLKPFLGHLRADQLTSEIAGRAVDSRLTAGASNGTINRELSALRRMFALGKKSTPPKVRFVPSMPKLREANARTGFLEDGQYRKLLEYCPQLWFRTIVEVGRMFSMETHRDNRIAGLGIDLMQRTIRLEPGTTKNREGRCVTMTDALDVLISACVRGKSESDFVFTRPDGSPVISFRGLSWEKCRHLCRLPWVAVSRSAPHAWRGTCSAPGCPRK